MLTTIEEIGRWYLLDRWYERSVKKDCSSLIYDVVSAYLFRGLTGAKTHNDVRSQLSQNDGFILYTSSYWIGVAVGGCEFTLEVGASLLAELRMAMRLAAAHGITG